MNFRRAKATICGLVGLSAALAAAPALADPHSVPVKVLAVRAYTTGANSSDTAYVTTSNPSICGATTNTGFSISLADVSGQGILSVALSALATGNLVTVEVSNATGCTSQFNGGPQIQSLTILSSGYNGPF